MRCLSLGTLVMLWLAGSIAAGNVRTILANADSLLHADNPRAALAVYDSARQLAGDREESVDRARALKGAADAMLALFVETDSAAYVDQALTNYSQIFRIIANKQQPALWTDTKIMQARAYTRLATVRDREKNLKLARRSLEDVRASGNLKTLTHKRRSFYRDLGETLAELGDVNAANKLFRDAAALYESALLPFDSTTVGADFDNLLNLVEVYRQLADLPGNAEDLNRAGALALALDSLSTRLTTNQNAELDLLLGETLSTSWGTATPHDRVRIAVAAAGAAARYFEQAGNRKSALSALVCQAQAAKLLADDAEGEKFLRESIELSRRAHSLSSPSDYPYVHFQSALQLAEKYSWLALEGQTRACVDSAFMFSTIAQDFFSKQRRPATYVQICYVRANCYYALSRVDDFRGNLHLALAAAEEANEVIDPRRYVSDYVNLMRMQGIMYTSLSWAEDRADNLRRALACFDRGIAAAAAEGADEEVLSFDSPRATALASLAALENPVANLTQAISLFQAVGARIDRDADPGAWASATANIAVAYSRLADHVDTVANLNLSLQHYDSALAAVSPQAGVLARAQNLRQSAAVCLDLARYERDHGRLAAARERLLAARSLTAQEDAADQQAAVDFLLGRVAMESYSLGSDVNDLRDAVACFTAGSAASHLPGHARTLANLTEANLFLANALDSLPPAEAAIQTADQVLALPDVNSDRSLYAWVLSMRGRAYMLAADFNSPEANLTYAAEDLARAAPLICDSLPQPLCAETAFTLGLSCSRLGYLRDSPAAFENSITAFEAALPYLTDETQLSNLLTALNNIADGYLQIARIERRPGYLDIAENKFRSLIARTELAQFPELADVVRLNLDEVSRLRREF